MTIRAEIAGEAEPQNKIVTAKVSTSLHVHHFDQWSGLPANIYQASFASNTNLFQNDTVTQFT